MKRENVLEIQLNKQDVHPNDMSDKVLEEFWYLQLPSAVRNIVVGLTGSLDTHAERADRIWESFAVSEVAATSAPPENAVIKFDARFQALESAVLALTVQVWNLSATRATEKRPARIERENWPAEDRAPITLILRGYKSHNE